MSSSTNFTSTTITAAQLKQVLDEGAKPRILDVRTGGEFESVHIPGSHNVPLDSLDAHLVELAAGDAPVIVVCQSGARADKACERLMESGKSSIALLEGGVQAWQNAGGDVVAGAVNRWAMDRQVRLVAGALVLAAVLVSLVVPGAKWLAAAVGFGLFFSAVSNTCTMGMLLAKLPYNRPAGAGPDDLRNAVSALTS